MFSSKRSRFVAAGIAAVVIAGGSYGIVDATSSTATSASTNTTAHGGELTVDTEPGHGAAFHLRLPRPETFQVAANESQGRLP